MNWLNIFLSISEGFDLSPMCMKKYLLKISLHTCTQRHLSSENTRCLKSGLESNH